MADTAQQVTVVLHWFLNFHSDNRNTFLQKLLELVENESDPLSQLLKGLDLGSKYDKSIIDCQLGLFENWYGKWDRLTKDHFISELSNLDARVNHVFDTNRRFSQENEY
jgi:hypothetical protein